MSIEVLNESGHDLTSSDLAALCRFVLDRMRCTPWPSFVLRPSTSRRSPSCTSSGWRRRGRPTCSPSPWTSCAPDWSTRSPRRGLLGDVVLCPDVAVRQAATAGHSLDDEIELLTVHGILHLLGYDHAEPEEQKEMFGLQEELLAAWRAR